MTTTRCAARLSTWPAWLAILTSTHTWRAASLIIHTTILRTADLHTDDKAERAGHDAADRHAGDCPGT